MSIQNFFDEIKKGLKHPVYLLHAGDPYMLKEALFSVKGTIPESVRDFLFHAFDLEAPETPPQLEHVMDVLHTMPFLTGGRKVVALEGAQKIPSTGLKTLSAYVSRPSPDSVLILFYAGALKKGLKDNLRGVKAISLDIMEKDMPYWVSEKAARKGLKLSPRAVDYLIGTVGAEPGLLSSEVEKLGICGKKNLDREDLAEMVRGSGGYDVFDLTDALRKRDLDSVFRIYACLAKTQEPVILMGAINWHYGRTRMESNEKARIFALLNEADIMMKSTYKAFPMEYLLLRLLRATGRATHGQGGHSPL